MTKFVIHGENYHTGEKKIFEYDNEFSIITNRGVSIDLSKFEDYKGNFYHKTRPFDTNNPINKSNTPTKVKIQLGMKCNYTCEYCSQAAHVENSIDFTPKHIDEFMLKLKNVDLSKLKQVEFWGGEPLVYWKTIRGLVERFNALEKQPIQYLMITNGSILSKEINEFLDANNFAVGISHDGPGQPLRGPDPCGIDDKMQWIKDLYSKLSPKGRISFNSILSKDNYSRTDIYKYFKTLFGEDVRIGEGYFLYVTNDGGDHLSLYDYQDMIKYRRDTFGELSVLSRAKVSILDDHVTNFIRSVVNSRNYHTVGQRCGMDKSDHVAVDMLGNVISCQNVSGTSNSFNSKSHTIGNIEKLEEVKLNTGTHWSNRKECVNCPVLQMCGGMCFLLKDKYWERSCDNAYNDVVPFFMYAFEIMTGFIPYYIDGPIPDWRKDVLGMDRPNIVRKKKTVIPLVKV